MPDMKCVIIEVVIFIEDNEVLTKQTRDTLISRFL